MRRWVLAITMLLSLLPVSGEAAEFSDFKGLQPLSPYGVFSTFSAESLKQNKIGFAATLERSVEPNFYRTTFQFAYGLHDRFELNMTLPFVINWEEHRDGLEDFNIGIKHRLVDEGAYMPALAYLLAVSLPSGKDLFSTDGSVGGGLILTKKVGPFKGHLNVLYTKPHKTDLKDQYLLNGGLELAITHDSKVLAELVGRKNIFKNKLDLLEWRVGY